MKRSYRNCFALVLLMALSAQVEVAVAASAEQQGIIWRIERTGLKPSYLMGTIHSEDERVRQLPDKVMRIFDQCDSFSAELKLDMASMQVAGQKMFYKDGTELKSVLGHKRYAKAVRLLTKHGIPEAAIRYMKPWAAAVSLSKPPGNFGVVLDMWLYQRAEQQGKRMHGLETVAEQMSVFEAFSQQQQIAMLDEAIQYYHELNPMVDELIRYYLRRNLTVLKEVSDKYMRRGDQVLAQKFKQHAIIDRNYRMVRRMIPRLHEGNSFIAVGALHLPGKEGMLRLLEKQGYKVTAIY